MSPVLVEKKKHFRHLERHRVTESAVGLLHFQNDVSLFHGHSLCSNCVESCTRVTRRKIIVTADKLLWPQEAATFLQVKSTIS